jgi:hypothetical protein
LLITISGPHQPSQVLVIFPHVVDTTWPHDIHSCRFSQFVFIGRVAVNLLAGLYEAFHRSTTFL